MEENDFEKKLYDIFEQNINIPPNITNSILSFDYKKKTKRNTIQFRKLSIAFSCFILSMSLIVYAYTKNINYESKNSIGYVNDSLKDAAENGYIQNVNMEYSYQNNIGSKIDYIIMSDYNLNILFNFDISKLNNITREANIQDLLIYDENYNIIFCYDNNIYKKFCKKNNIVYMGDCSENQYANGYGIQLIESNDNNNKTLYTIRSIKGFPKSKKLYIQFKTISFDQKNKIKGNWIIELNLNEQFYNRDTIKYKFKKQSNDIEIISANSTITTTRITYKMKNIDISKINKISMYIEDIFGNRYDVNTIEDSISVYKNQISATFPITTKDNLEEFTLYIYLDNNNYIPISFIQTY